MGDEASKTKPETIPKSRALSKFVIRKDLKLTNGQKLKPIERAALDLSPHFDIDGELKDADDVLINIQYCGMNLADIYHRVGAYPSESLVPGVEISGTVAKTGKNVTDLKIGDHVCATTPDNGYADQIVLPQHQIIKLKSHVDLVQGAAMVMGLSTACHNIERRAGLLAGESVLIHGGAGGTGMYAIQLAKRLGAKKIFTTIGCPENAKAVMKLEESSSEKAIIPILYKGEDTQDFEKIVMQQTGGKGVDVIMDIIGAPYLQKNLRCLKDRGRLRIISFKGTNPEEGTLVGKDGHTVNGVFCGGMLTGDFAAFTHGQKVNADALQHLLATHTGRKISLLKLIEENRETLSAPGRTITIGGDRLRQLAPEEKSDLRDRVSFYINDDPSPNRIHPVVNGRFPLSIENIEYAHARLMKSHSGKIILENKAKETYQGI